MAKGKMPKIQTVNKATKTGAGTRALGKSSNTRGALSKGDNPYGSAAGNPTASRNK